MNIKELIKGQKNEFKKIQDLMVVVSETDVLDTADVEDYYRNTDRIINGSRIDNAWKALSMKYWYTQSLISLIRSEIERKKDTLIPKEFEVEGTHFK